MGCQKAVLAGSSRMNGTLPSVVPRTARIVLRNSPHHLIQRGHNGSLVFAQDADYQFYLDVLEELKLELDFRLYSHCLMTNHVHLVVNPGDDASTIGKLMKRLGGRYTQYINKAHGRTGTVWEGRFKSSPIDTNEYLLECCRYIDLNPERAGMVQLPEHYRWSSYGEKVGRRPRRLIDEDGCYRGLGRTRREREEAYRDWIMAAVPDGAWELIRTAAQCGQLTGGEQFIEQVERETGRRVEWRPRGRPKKRDLSPFSKGVCPK
jgi:putative transposase